MVEPFPLVTTNTWPPVQILAPSLSAEVSQVDNALGTTSVTTSPPLAEEDYLASRRLGIATALFRALRLRHAPTASHCLRVALLGSCWAAQLGLSADECDAFEIAALLHDVGKIGIPDHILLKPGTLTADERLVMDRYRNNTQQLVAAFCASPQVLDILRHQGVWYDGTHALHPPEKTTLPLGSRMLNILDAYDAMTTEHVYRRAMTHERAIAELFQYAGKQFDPELVESFAGLAQGRFHDHQTTLTRRWLQELHPAGIHQLLRDGFDRSTAPSLLPAFVGDVHSDFHHCLLNNMHDGVIFVDQNRRIMLWNRAVERMTGIRAGTMLERQFAPRLLGMCRSDGTPFLDVQCPAVQALRTRAQTLQRVSITGRSGHLILVNLHAVPVISDHGEVKGVAILLQDASSQVTLEERVQMLQERATQDPLTKVANRAEFERVFPEFVQAHRELQKPCSLIIADLDHFKRINDIFGHQAGDEALKVFAQILRGAAVSGDMVARYGGEEFVMLCADLDAAAAMQRAEDIRRMLATHPIDAMDGQCLTASFGVTELQPGDTPESFLRRADRGLLQAKELGRNRVIQLGTGYTPERVAVERRSWWSRLLSGSVPLFRLSRDLVTAVPLPLTVEKLKGYISDHDAEVVELRERVVHLRISGRHTPLLRRHSDRPLPFDVRLEFYDTTNSSNPAGRPYRTRIRVCISPSRQRDRRRRDLEHRAAHILASVKAYLMAEDAAGTPPLEIPSSAVQSLDLRKLLGNVS